MKLHHLDCVTMCPPGRRLMDGRDGARGPARLPCHCVAVGVGDRVVLLDTGFGLQDVREPGRRLSGLFSNVLCRPLLREEDTAVRQLERLGIDANAVTDVVLTHLDFDHAGGLDDFPRAKVHLLRDEHDAARRQDGWLVRRRFRPEQWSSLPRWVLHDAAGGAAASPTEWFGFRAVRPLEHLPLDLALIPLPGHTPGHAGIALHDGGRWLLHAGDAYFFHGELEHERRCPPGLRLYQRLMDSDREQRFANQARLRELHRAHPEVEIFCAHDSLEMERHAGRLTVVG